MIDNLINACIMKTVLTSWTACKGFWVPPGTPGPHFERCQKDIWGLSSHSYSHIPMRQMEQPLPVFWVVEFTQPGARTYCKAEVNWQQGGYLNGAFHGI